MLKDNEEYNICKYRLLDLLDEEVQDQFVKAIRSKLFYKVFMDDEDCEEYMYVLKHIKNKKR